MAYTDYLEESLLELVFRGVAWTPPDEVYLALYTEAPTDAGDDGTEMVDGDYERQQVDFTEPGVDGRLSNEIDVAYANLPESTIVAVAVFDAALDGNMLAYETISPVFPVAEGDNLLIPAGTLSIGMD